MIQHFRYIAVLLVISAARPSSVLADAFETRTLIGPKHIHQSLDISRHIFLDYDDGALSPEEIRRAVINEEEEFKRIKKPSPISWNLGYGVTAVSVGDQPMVNHTFQVGLISELSKKVTLHSIIKADLIPAENLRTGEVQFTFGNLELLQFYRRLQMEGWPPGEFDPELDEDEWNEKIQPSYQRLFRNQIVRDEQNRRKENRNLLRPKKTRRFERRALFSRLNLIFGTASWTPPLAPGGISLDRKMIWGSVGPELHWLPRKDFTARFSLLATLYQGSVSRFTNGLIHPEVKMPLADPYTGLLQVGPYLRGFSQLRFAAGFVTETSPGFLWNGDFAIGVYPYGNANYIPSGSFGFLDQLSKDWNWGIDLNGWFASQFEFTGSLRTTLQL